MKKKKILTGVAIGAALTGVVFGGCGQVQDLYGPPPELDEPVLQAETDPASTTEVLYGPPADLTTEAEDSQVTDAQTTKSQFAEEETASTEYSTQESEINTAMPLYGPPADVAE